MDQQLNEIININAEYADTRGATQGSAEFADGEPSGRSNGLEIGSLRGVASSATQGNVNAEYADARGVAECPRGELVTVEPSGRSYGLIREARGLSINGPRKMEV